MSAANTPDPQTTGKDVVAHLRDSLPDGYEILPVTVIEIAVKLLPSGRGYKARAAQRPYLASLDHVMLYLKHARRQPVPALPHA